MFSCLKVQVHWLLAVNGGILTTFYKKNYIERLQLIAKQIHNRTDN